MCLRGVEVRHGAGFRRRIRFGWRRLARLAAAILAGEPEFGQIASDGHGEGWGIGRVSIHGGGGAALRLPAPDLLSYTGAGRPAPSGTLCLIELRIVHFSPLGLFLWELEFDAGRD